MTRLARRLRAVLASAVSAALVVLSPGLEAPRLFAQTFRAAPVETGAASAASAAPLAAPALAPIATLAAPAAPSFAPALSVPTAASLPAVAAAAAPLAAAAADANVGAAGVYGAGRGIEDVLTGARSDAAGDAPAAAPALFDGPGAPALPAAAIGEFGRVDTVVGRAGVPSPAPAPKSVDSAISYRIHRALLRTVAALTGAVNTLPPAGPALTDALIAQAADRRAVISDYDDTLGSFSEPLAPDMVEAVRAVHAAGKTFDVISDRGDVKRGSSPTVFESLETLPVATRAGMYVAANSGGIVYRYDENGVPVKVYEAPAMTDAVKAEVAASAEATKARLAEAGTVAHDGVGKIPTESWGPYSYALMLKPGSSEASVRATAAILQAELDRRGVDVEVNPRFAKDPANPPYVTLSIITKEGAARYIAAARQAGPKDVVILGDSMYVPHAAAKTSWLSRLGERAAGVAMPALGNRTDANMERGVPGALTLSVGTTGDPRPDHLFVLAGKGPSVTRRVLLSVASKTADAPKAPGWGAVIAHGAIVAALFAATAAAYYAMAHAFGAVLQNWQSDIQDGIRGGGAFFGAAGTLVFGASLYRMIVNPASDYQLARQKAVDIAAKRGASPNDVRFVEATASMPTNDGEHWKYSFEIPGRNGGAALVYVDARRFLGGPVDLRASIYEGARAAEGKRATALAPHLFAKGAQVDPQTALDEVRRAAPTFGAQASVALDYREETLSGDGDLWYRFYDGKGGVASVNARTSEVRVEAGAQRASSLSASISRTAPIAGFTGAVYDRALASARELAAKAGYAPDNLRVERATLTPRETGEDWTFEFVSPRQDSRTIPWEFVVTVRRTAGAPDAVETLSARSEGPRRLFAAVRAQAFAELVRVTPAEAIAKTGPDARTLELQAHWPESGPAQLWYVIRGEKGRELMAIHAVTGAVELPKPFRRLRAALAVVGLFGGVIALYGLIYYGFMHSPAATSPNEYIGPTDIGGVFGAGILGAALSRGASPTPKPTDDDVRARASAVTSYKGYPWSSTEYSSAYYPALERLKADGATAEQVALFEKLCADAPLREGRFNPWSGD